MINKLKLPDYNNCLVNLANSVLKKFGVQTTAATLPLADKYLAGNYKNIVILLLDALGTSILEKHLEPDGFFRSHLKGSINSIYPPTTTAATTSFMSGLYPNEHGWLGWDVYYPQLNKNVTIFNNTEQLTEKQGAEPTVINSQGKAIWTEDSLNKPLPAADYHVGHKYTYYKNIFEKINAAGSRAEVSGPFFPPFPQDLESILKRIKTLCNEAGQKFIYAYWCEPDSIMHKTGTTSRDTHETVTALEKRIEEFTSDLTDTLFLITADHGHIDSNNLCILDYPEIMNCLVRMPSIEPRTVNLFVKEEFKESFPALFRKTFGDDFLLLTHDEVMQTKLFGIGTNHPELEQMIGDFVALAVTDKSLYFTHYKAQIMPGNHAGLTPEEYTIPLIVIVK